MNSQVTSELGFVSLSADWTCFSYMRAYLHKRQCLLLEKKQRTSLLKLMPVG